ncbi:MAG: cytochrome c3 family protein [Phycisphaerae bacterium]
MNRGNVFWLAAVASMTLFGGIVWAGIEGSKHDFSKKGWSGGDTCSACHSPHRTVPPKVAPLWNPNADLSRTFGSRIGTKDRAGQGTLMCLRCHDGTIVAPAVSGFKKSRFANRQNRARFQAGHRTIDHPVGVKYPQFNKGFRPATSVIASQTVRLPDGNVECTSCHDPHNQAGHAKMLVTTNARSALCLTCHKK